MESKQRHSTAVATPQMEHMGILGTIFVSSSVGAKWSTCIHTRSFCRSVSFII